MDEWIWIVRVFHDESFTVVIDPMKYNLKHILLQQAINQTKHLIEKEYIDDIDDKMYYMYLYYTISYKKLNMNIYRLFFRSYYAAFPIDKLNGVNKETVKSIFEKYKNLEAFRHQLWNF